jgi:hypothetical protein
VAATAVVVVAIGLSIGLVASDPSPSNSSVAGAATALSKAAASNARSAPSPGGAAGTITSISTSGFTIKTSAGQTATVTESTSTKNEMGTKTISRSALTKGEGVLVLGITNSTYVSASQVIVESSSSKMLTTSSAVISFTRGSPTDSKQDGQIPAGWSEGSGTIASGTAANKVIEAALTAYPGGIVDRVVVLSGGEYNVHYIGVNWPHHVFVNQDFKVVGAV